MTEDAIRVLAGECTVRFEDGDARATGGNGRAGATGADGDGTAVGENHAVREERGAVVVVAKPDNTVLVHDRDGYRPVAWLTRADAVTYARDGTGFSLEAVRDGSRLSVSCRAEHGDATYPASSAGPPVGDCPDCGGALVRAAGAVSCLSCDARYRIPRDATVTEERCGTCRLPLMRVERGEAFELCIDRSCEALDDLVTQRFDRVWACPGCGGDLLILRRGGLIAGCENYPTCETGYAFPAGTIDGSCPSCALPTFETGTDSRCLDATCSGA